ncbi:MAG TPA: fibronectin type III domain-containing protein, partial [Mycobacterium sp.]|nr:fibronectin type III domain-containing protein [Mycobacterium sp.]
MRILPARTRRMRRLSASALAVAALVAGMFGFTPTAGATVALSVTATSVTLAAPNSTVGLPGLNVTGAQPTDQLQVTVATSVGTLSITTISGLTLSYNNHWTGDASITFTGAQADIDAALASVSLVSGNNAGQTASISLTAMIAQSGYVYLAPNQHFYQYVASSDITWTAADAAAKAATFNGQRGYLATIPNDTVNNFITSKIQGALSVWFGAYAYPNENGYGRVWRWTKGTDESPLQGQVISNCASNAANTTCSFSNNAGLYSHWASGEPNNYNGGENVPVTNWGAANGNWNDLAPNATGIAGYVIEYGDQSTGSTGFTGVVNTASNVLIATVPGTPTGVSAARGNGSATVTFTAPAGNGSPITSYTITPSAGSPVSCAASPCLVGGLTNGTSYQFKVHATNGIGDGADSAWTSPVTPATVPGAPTGVSADRGNTSATVSFAAPAFDGGSAVTSYTVTSAPGGITNTCAGSPCVVTGLTNGTAYQFEVHATNSVGNGAESAWTSQVTPATVPGASTGVTATRGDGSATVTFTPGGNGGSA